MLPNVEKIAKPIGPQPHAPAAEPIIEPKTLPDIFLLEMLRIRIRYMFIGNTKPAKAESITIKENPNSLP